MGTDGNGARSISTKTTTLNSGSAIPTQDIEQQALHEMQHEGVIHRHPRRPLTYARPHIQDDRRNSSEDAHAPLFQQAIFSVEHATLYHC